MSIETNMWSHGLYGSLSQLHKSSAILSECLAVIVNTVDI